MNAELLHCARLASGELVDVRIVDGLVAEIDEAGSLEGSAGGAVLDLDGALLLPAAAEPHAHLDKSQSWDAIQPPLGDLPKAVRSWHDFAGILTEDDIERRALSTLRRMVRAGFTAVRTHADLLPGDDPVRGIRALARVKQRVAEVLDLQIVVLGLADKPTEVFAAALDAGADLVGGAPHLSPDPIADLQRLVALAAERGIGMDIHTDENLDGPITIDTYAALTRGWEQPRTASHCSRLSTFSPQRLAEVAAALRDADIGVVALPITNLYLQGRDAATTGPQGRGIAPIGALAAAGVRVAAGADNVRDPFNPVGRCDPFETSSLLVAAAHLAPADALAAVTTGARDVLGLPAAGPHVGAVADLVAVRAVSIEEAIAYAPAERTVFRRGRVIARTRVEHDSAQELDGAPGAVGEERIR
ncbi:amidohydrolase family protein [Microbacterium sediminicola]|uniref:Amidohydrolase family protein n=1 Tax=Microbacterium sediminicola TaxID=415210 RepID=A0ABP4UN87_9MICO